MDVNLNADKQREQQAKPVSDYVMQSVIYQMHLRAFTPEGTLRAASTRLPKLAELGVDILYLTPVCVADDHSDPTMWSPRQRALKTKNPRNPYRIMDYDHVDPEYGTDEDLKEFVAFAHKLKMRVMLDNVFYHCGPSAVFLKEHPNFVERDKDGKMVCGAWGFPKINHDNLELREYLLKNMEYWATDFGVDGFRADVSYKIPTSFWLEARQRLEKICPDIIMLAEGGYEGQLKAFDIDYYSNIWPQNLHQIYDDLKPASSVRKTWEDSLLKFPRDARLIHNLENHDIANDAGDNRLDKRWGSRMVDTALVLNFTIDGVPMLYNGQEIADTAQHSIYSLPGQMFIDWSNAETPTGKARFELCQKLSKLHHAEKALTHGTVTWLENSLPDDVVSFLRTTEDEQVLTVINMKKKNVAVEIKMPSSSKSTKLQPLLSRDAKETASKGNKKIFTLESCGFFVGKRDTIMETGRLMMGAQGKEENDAASR